MRVVDIIAKKRDKQELSVEEINWFIEGYTRGEIPDYQTSALLMAILFQGMSIAEVTALTMAMVNSGDQLDLSEVSDYVVDKHSSGGVGDKTSLVVLPLVAACGVPVAKMSGRGLGYSGGTLDKLESIPGFTSNLSEEKFIEQARRIGISLAGQSRDLAPADGKLYALRDVTGTVPSLPLIASSIMSKKIAAGAQGIVLDVKMGSGAFMPTLEQARGLAQTMVDIGKGLKRDMVALISDMNQPLGNAVGNALEVREAIETLKGGGPDDLREHCYEVAAHMLRLAGRGERWQNKAAAREALEQHMADGSALRKFRELVSEQGGDPAYVDEPSRLPGARLIETINASESGWIAQVDALEVARAAFLLGAGRQQKGDSIDLAVGVETHVNVGDKINQGQKLATIHANSEDLLNEAREHLSQAIRIMQTPCDPLPLFYDVLET